MDKGFPSVILGIGFRLTIRYSPILEEILYFGQRQFHIGIPQEGGEIVEHRTAACSLEINKGDFGIGLHHDVLALEIAMHQHLVLCLDGNSQQGIELSDTFRNFGNTLVSLEIIFSKVVRFPLQRVEIKTAQPQIGTGAEQRTGNILPLNQRIDDLRIEDSNIARLLFVSRRQDIIEQVMFAQVFLQHGTGGFIDAIDARNRESKRTEGFGIVNKAFEVFVNRGGDLQYGTTIIRCNTVILAARTGTGNRGHFIIGIAVGRQKLLNSGRNNLIHIIQYSKLRFFVNSQHIRSNHKGFPRNDPMGQFRIRDS